MVCLHADQSVSNNYAVRDSGIYYYVPGREELRLASITLHEGAHASLDNDHLYSSGWRAARQADGNNFITEYARTVGEDLAESFTAYFLVKYSRNIEDYDVRQILLTIPNRIDYLERQGFDMRPWSSPVRSLTVTPGPVLATYCDPNWLDCRN